MKCPLAKLWWNLGMGKTVRIIGSSKYNTRGADVSANIARDRRIINYLRRLVVDEGTGSAKLMYEKRPGWTSTSTAISGTSSSWPYARSYMRNSFYGGRGYVWGANQHFGNSAVIDIVYATTSLGQITPAAGSTNIVYQTEAQTSSALYHLLAIPTGSIFASTTNYGYYYTVSSSTSAGTLTQITDADYPTNGAGPLTQKWGYVFQATENGYAQNSDLNSVSAWTAGSYFPCNAVPDKGYGVWSNGADLLAYFGSKHIEILYNARVATLSPLKRVEGGVIRMGAHSSAAICYAMGGLAFIGKSPDDSSFGVYLLSGLTLKKISSTAIDQYLYTYTGGIFRARMSSFVLAGEPILLIQVSPNQGSSVLSIACMLRDSTWFEWGFSSSAPIWPVGANNYSAELECVSGGNDTRYLYTIDEVTPAYTDNGNAYTATLQTGRTDFGTGDRKTLNWLELVGDTSGTGDSHVLSISTDDGGTFTQVGTIDMSTRNRRLGGLGGFDDLAIKIEHSTGTASRIEAIDANISKWGH